MNATQAVTQYWSDSKLKINLEICGVGFHEIKISEPHP